MRQDRFTRVIRPAAVSACGLVLALALGAGALASVRGGSYKGTTSEGLPVSFTIGGHTLRGFKSGLAYNGKCGPGGGPLLSASIPSLPIARNGTFGADTRLRLGTVVNDPGRVFGRVSGATVTGTIEQFLNGRVNRCYVEGFSARRR